MTDQTFAAAFLGLIVGFLFALFLHRPTTSVTRTVSAGTITATLRLDCSQAQASLKEMIKELDRFDATFKERVK